MKEKNCGKQVRNLYLFSYILMLLKNLTGVSFFCPFTTTTYKCKVLQTTVHVLHLYNMIYATMPAHPRALGQT